LGTQQRRIAISLILAERLVPGFDAGELLFEVDTEESFKEAAAAYHKTQGRSFMKTFEWREMNFPVNIGSHKFHVMRDRTCACCGVIGTRTFIGVYQDKETGESGYNLRLYAETKDKPDMTPHLVLMTRDHIVPLKDGGADELENLQCLCYLCNSMKESLGVDIKAIRKSLFTSYRIYRGTLTRQLVDEKLEAAFKALDRSKSVVNNIAQGLPKIQSETARTQVIAKLALHNERVQKLEAAIRKAQTEAQVKGTDSPLALAEVESLLKG